MKPFTNEKRSRCYGLRVGDIVQPLGLQSEPLACGNCKVVELSVMDNNRVYLQDFKGNKPFQHVAEWCKMLEPVDGEEGWRLLEPIKYLGEFQVDETTNPYHGFTKDQWAMLYIEKYGQIDGDHHKNWVIDQIARILNGTPVHVVEARWGNKYGITTREFRHHTGEPSQEYKDWLHKSREWDEEIQDYMFNYDEGIAP